MINWKVRFKNKTFWMAFIPAVILLIQAVANVVGVNLDLTALSQKLLEVVSAVFAVLAILGVVNDPTTKGVSDSTQAMSYEEPREDKE